MCFKQAQPKMCHSPKIEDGVDIFFVLLGLIFLDFLLFEELETAISPKPKSF